MRGSTYLQNKMHEGIKKATVNGTAYLMLKHSHGGCFSHHKINSDLPERYQCTKREDPNICTCMLLKDIKIICNESKRKGN